MCMLPFIPRQAPQKPVMLYIPAPKRLCTEGDTAQTATLLPPDEQAKQKAALEEILTKDPWIRRKNYTPYL